MSAFITEKYIKNKYDKYIIRDSAVLVNKFELIKLIERLDELQEENNNLKNK